MIMDKKLKKIKISVVIPAYNVGKYIGETIQSLVDQSYKNVEIVVVDDNSADDTGLVVKSFMGRADVKYERFDRNQGASAAFNRGHRLATGDLVIYLDSDNFLHPKTFEEAVNFLDSNPDYGVVYFDLFHFFDNDGKRKVYYHKLHNPSGLIFDDLINGVVSINLSRVLFKSSIIKDVFFDESLRYGGDWDYWLTVAFKKVKFGFLNKKLLYSRQRASGNSTGGKGRFGSKKDYITVLNKWKGNLSEEEINKLKINEKIKRAELMAVLNLAEFSGRREALAELKKIESLKLKDRIQKSLIFLFLIVPTKLIGLLFSKYYDFKTNKINFKELSGLTIEKTLKSTD